MTPPRTLDRAGIAARIPHAGRMCLLDALSHWDDHAIACEVRGHGAPDHPLRSASGLLAPAAIEMAAQAMALHGGLLAAAGGRDAAPSAGYLASVRQVRLGPARLDDAPGPLQVRAERLSGGDQQVLYRFDVRDAAGRMLAEGRAVVVLNTPLAALAATGAAAA